MKKRMIRFDASEGAGQAMHKVIATYAHAAYPVGGSDCAAATRQALLDVADLVLQGGPVEISARQRPMLKAAIEWYFKEVKTDDQTMYQKLLAQFSKQKK